MDEIGKKDETNRRLEKAREKAGFKSARSAALKHRWKVSTYASHENGQTSLKHIPEEAEKYAKAFNVELAWLLNITERPNKIVERPSHITRHNLVAEPSHSGLDDVANIPEIDIVVGAADYARGFSQEETDGGQRLVPQDAVRSRWGIPVPFLRSELHVGTDRVHMIPVLGDSMATALFDGDRAVINLDDRDIGRAGIFAFLDDRGTLQIQQVQLVRGSEGRDRIECSYINPRYKPYQIDLADPVKIIGRVSYKFGRVI